MATGTVTNIGEKKAATRAAVIGVDGAAGILLEDCFRQFQIEVVALEDSELQQRLSKERFEALVLPLQPETESLIEHARNSLANKHAVIYGIARDRQDAMRHSRFGINVLFEAKWLQEPLHRAAVLKVVSATHQLVSHALRRHVRVPIVTEVVAQSGRLRFTAYTQEISAGGMSMNAAPKLNVGQLVQLSFALPTGTQVNVSANICWVREADSTVGARFDPADERRNAVRDWIEQYLEFS
jgi:hypothetical protein